MNKSFQMYKEMQISADISTCTKKQLLIKLYEAVILNLNEAINAINTKNIELKIKKIEKSLNIIEVGLMMSLSKDGAKEVAESLELFYEDASTQIVVANATNNTSILANIKMSFVDLKKCWEQVSD